MKVKIGKPAGWTLGLIASAIICYSPKHANKPGCGQDIELSYSRSQIEEIKKEVKTAEEAFYRVSQDLVITFNADSAAGCLPATRLMSMQENYSLGVADCLDAAVDFTVMLSDNPEYKARLFKIWQKDDSIWNRDKHKARIHHSVVVYEHEEKFGIVSFNALNDKRQYILENKHKWFLFEDAEIYFDERYPSNVFNFMTKTKFGSLEEAMIAFNNDTNLGGSIEYDEILLPVELMMFGHDLEKFL